MKLRRAFADANKIVRRSMDFRYIGELTVPRSRVRTTMTRSIARPSYLGALSAGTFYRGFTVGNCHLL